MEFQDAVKKVCFLLNDAAKNSDRARRCCQDFGEIIRSLVHFWQDKYLQDQGFKLKLYTNGFYIGRMDSNGNRHGYGVSVVDGNSIYCGDWSNDKWDDDEGVMVFFSNRVIYIGSFVRGNLTGRARKYQLNNGLEIAGKFVDGNLVELEHYSDEVSGLRKNKW